MNLVRKYGSLVVIALSLVAFAGYYLGKGAAFKDNAADPVTSAAPAR